MNRSRYWFEQAPIGKAIMHMAIPMILGMAAMNVYSFTNTLFIFGMGWGVSGAAFATILPNAAAVAFCLLADIVCSLLRSSLVGLFSVDPAVLLAGGAILAAQLAAIPFASESGLTAGCFQAFDAGVAANAMSFARGRGIVPLAFADSAFFGIGGLIWSLFFAEALSFAIGCLLAVGNRKNLPLSKGKPTPNASAAA